jgi:hypothetical protein
MAKTDVPVGKSDRMSGQEIVTLVNEALAAIKGTTGSTTLFRREWQPLGPIPERLVASLDRDDSAAPEITVFETAAVTVGLVAIVLTVLIFFFQLSP